MDRERAERERTLRGFDKAGASAWANPEIGDRRPVVGKRTLTELLPPASTPVQRMAAGGSPSPVMPSAPGSTTRELFGGGLAGTVVRRALAGPGGRGDVAAGAEPALARAATSGGAPLPAALRRELEASLRADLGGVRVHTGSASAAAAAAIGARAYTVGNDIHFGAGQFLPDSAAGRHLIAHETAHTVQQHGASQGAVQESLEVSQPGDAHEVEAERFADAFSSGASQAVAPVSRGVVSRMAIQRFSHTDLDWKKVGQVKRSDDGQMGGVYFVQSGAQRMVIKLTSSPDFTQFAGEVMRDGVQVPSPASEMVAIDSDAGRAIGAAIEAHLGGDHKAEFLKGIRKATHFMAMESVDAASLKRLDAERMSKLMSSKEVFHAIGRVAVADAFLGIGDRLLTNQNPGNLMFDADTLQVFAIDNEQTHHAVHSPLDEIRSLRKGDTRYIENLIMRALFQLGSRELAEKLRANLSKYEKWVKEGAEQGIQHLAAFCEHRPDLPDAVKIISRQLIELAQNEKASGEKCLVQ
jgi:Domain of unknown function (DUF4157)